MCGSYLFFAIGVTLLSFVVTTKGQAVESPASSKPVPALSHFDAPTPPPEKPVYEVEQGDRKGYLWANGYWSWNGKQHVWQSGRWIKQRSGYVWVGDTWAHRGAMWHLYPGHWEKDQNEDQAAKVEIPREENKAEEVVPLETNTAPPEINTIPSETNMPSDVSIASEAKEISPVTPSAPSLKIKKKLVVRTVRSTSSPNYADKRAWPDMQRR